MSISKELIDAVNSNDIMMVKIILKNNMLLDPSFTLYDETSAYVLKHFSDLYEAHNGENIEINPNVWDENYLDGQTVELLSNFSRERVEHIRKVCAHIYGNVSKNKSDSTGTKENNTFSEVHNSSKKGVSQKRVGVGLAVGGAAVAVAGIVVSKPIVIGAGLVAAIAGGVLIATDK